MSAGHTPMPKRNTHGCCADKACTDQTCMELPAGKTCGDCRHFNHCTAFYAHKASDTYCDFYPRRFADRAVLAAQPTEAQWGDVLREVFKELERATSKFPTWPTDPLHALAVLGEEFGELTKGMLQLTYEPHKTSAEEVHTEAVQTAAMALRLAMSLGKYQYRASEQHAQSAIPPHLTSQSLAALLFAFEDTKHDSLARLAALATQPTSNAGGGA